MQKKRGREVDKKRKRSARNKTEASKEAQRQEELIFMVIDEDKKHGLWGRLFLLFLHNNLRES